MGGTAFLTVERANARGVIAAFICMFGAGLARAQDMEPRSYSASPIDTNFLIGSYQRTTGDVALDTDLPINLNRKFARLSHPMNPDGSALVVRKATLLDAQAQCILKLPLCWVCSVPMFLTIDKLINLVRGCP